MEVKVLINGEPVGKQRPKASFQSKRIYTPSKTINYENWVRFNYQGNPSFEDRAVEMFIKIYLPIPSSTSKKKKQQMLDYELFPTKKPDVDNVVKSLLDGLNGIAYEDDKQVISLQVVKLYDINPRVELIIRDVSENTLELAKKRINFNENYVKGIIIPKE